MCVKVYFGKRSASNKIDPCLMDMIKDLNKEGIKTVASCCGHDKYPRTIIVKNDFNTKETKNACYDFDTGIRVNDYKPQFRKQNQRWYKRDDEGYYYIPQVIERETIGDLFGDD